MKLFLSLLIAFFCISVLSAQEVIAAEDSAAVASLIQMEKALKEKSMAIMTDTVQENRVQAAKDFIPQLVEALQTENSFQYPFDSLQTISIQYPTDSSFRVFTWQLYVDIEDYRYFGAIQMNEPQLKLYPLTDGSEDVMDPEYDILDTESWYGAVYYNLVDFQTPEGTQYLLFGFDGYRFFDKRKIVDVLRFREGKPVFGSPVFATIEEGHNPITQNRLVREYFAGSSIKCNFDPELNLIITDHMSTMKRPDGKGLSLIPDGTYEGYVYKEGLWVYEEKLFHEMLDEAPRPKPVLDGRSKDLFGN